MIHAYISKSSSIQSFSLNSNTKMVNIVVKFKRVAEAFDEMARDGRRLCESSGSEHSAEAESFTDLSNLVNSFLERGSDEDVFNVDDEEEGNENGNDDHDDDEGGTQSQRKVLDFGVEEDLMSLFRIEDDDNVKMKIHAEVEKAFLKLDGSKLGFSPPPTGSKRRLVALLREKGLDAGLCKSKWDKKGQCPPGSYEYIDVIVEGTRYIVEVSLASEFEIARQAGNYTSLLQLFPTIFVGEVRTLKKIVRLMCNSIKMSMRADHIHVPPWRKLAYMQAKWLGPYRRTINEVPKASKPIDSNLATMRSIGFMAAPPGTSGFLAAPPTVSGYCREDFASRNFVRKVGNLSAAFNSSPMLL